MTETRRISVEDAMVMGIELHKRGMLSEAESVYSDVLRTVPENPDANHFIGVVTHQMGNSEKGIEYIKRSLELLPRQPSALNNLGNIYKETGRYSDALDTYEKVIAAAPDHVDTWVNLAVILRELKRPKDALETLQKVFELSSEHGEGQYVLGDVHRDLGNYDEALAAYAESARLCPESQLLPKSIARVLYQNGHKDEATRTLRNWLIRRPDDAVARHLLAAYAGDDVPARASDEYVRMCFDNFAKSFDECLKGLDYKAPELICDKLISLLPENQERTVLDIGCGTGLCGPMLRPVAKKLLGVDLSPGMLVKAKLLDVYDDLIEAELTEFMNRDYAAFDVIVCADTFVYFGELTKAFRAASDSMKSDGLFVFTVEQHLQKDRAENYVLQHHGRYSHTREYLRLALSDADFDIVTMDDVVLRKEESEPVGGLLVAARKP